MPLGPAPQEVFPANPSRGRWNRHPGTPCCWARGLVCSQGTQMKGCVCSEAECGQQGRRGRVQPGLAVTAAGSKCPLAADSRPQGHRAPDTQSSGWGGPEVDTGGLLVKSPLGVSSELQFLNCFSEFSTLKILVVSKIILRVVFMNISSPQALAGPGAPPPCQWPGNPEGLRCGVGSGGQ